MAVTIVSFQNWFSLICYHLKAIDNETESGNLVRITYFLSEYIKQPPYNYCILLIFSDCNRKQPCL